MEDECKCKISKQSSAHIAAGLICKQIGAFLRVRKLLDILISNDCMDSFSAFLYVRFKLQIHPQPGLES